MPVERSTDADRDLTVFVGSGELTFEDQMVALREFYGNEPTAHVVWDFRGIEGSRITPAQLRSIVAFVAEQRDKRPGGKTALVSGTDLDFGLSRMSQAYADSARVEWTIEVFRTMDEALAWLTEE